ncbi:MAG: hypothetical protein ACWGMZ_13350, partial [Thermoguttaceae bacterium]
MDIRKRGFLSAGRASCIFCVCAVALLSGLSFGYAFAQSGFGNEGLVHTGSFKEDQVDQKLYRSHGAIYSILRAGKFSSNQEEKDFDTYYKTYALPRWTQLSTLGNLQAYRKELL